MDVGKYEREALERRRDELLRKRGRYGLTPYEGMELDGIAKRIGMKRPGYPEPYVLPTGWQNDD